MTAGATYDVAVIGAGVVGAAIARELTRYGANVALIDAASDVGAGTSKANTAILHTGFDTIPGSLESQLVTRGYGLLRAYCDETGIAVEDTGALLVAWNDEQLASLVGIEEKARANGVTRLRSVGSDELYRLEPKLGPGALGALAITDEGIICPYSPPLAFAAEAVRHGTRFFREFAVHEILRDGPVITLRGSGSGAHEPVHCRYLVNAAGLGSDRIDALLGYARFTIKPRRGQLIVFDKLARGLVRHVLLPVPTKRTKGVLVSPTVFGNILLGPTAEELSDRDDRATTRDALAGLMEKGRAILPELIGEEVTATYAGLRAATEHQDYQLHVDAAARYVCAGGIRSTGLSASMAIAEYVREALDAMGLPMALRPDWQPQRVPYLGEVRARPAFDPAAVALDPDYGRIVCHCEKVSRGELRDALQCAVPAQDLDGLRRRTRCLQGRCQGFYCLADVVGLLAQHTGKTPATLLGVH